ncbi:MAG: hypothetical protein LBH27_02215 [Endomicrobium sp.]|jgi:TolB protein|nr:hypothetical protein [Endomicrobium sp.]
MYNLYCKDDIYLSIDKIYRKSGIAVECFNTMDKNSDSVRFAKIIRKIIENDLILSKHFDIVISIDAMNDFNKQQLFSLKKKHVSIIVNGLVHCKNTGDIHVEVKIIDAVTNDVIWKYNYKNKYSNYRHLAHEISDGIISRIKGEIGNAQSKVVFVNDSTKFKELYIVDYDGHNLQKLTKNNKINILPKWSPDGKSIIYTSYLYNNPDLLMLNFIDNKSRIISKCQGLNVTGSFSPNGENIILTLSKGKYPNLYMINTRGKLIRKIMNDAGYINTSPTYAPNGHEIAFVSDRCGYPQIYVMNINGGIIKRITTYFSCDSPAWSPDGNKIVFTMKQPNSSYDLCVYDLASGKIKKITHNKKNNENPSWSPDGRFLVFSSNRSGEYEIYITTIDGSHTRRLVKIDGSSFMPSWSPVLNKS